MAKTWSSDQFVLEIRIRRGPSRVDLMIHGSGLSVQRSRAGATSPPLQWNEEHNFIDVHRIKNRMSN